MLQPIISIIIPVYNAAVYLEDCIDSIINQTFTNCEFIFINDGSSDASLTILEKYRATDARIVLLNQINLGVSVARNNGLAVAKGNYIGFVDADDWLENDMFQTLFDSIENTKSDLVLTNIKRNFNGNEFITKYDFPSDKVLDLAYIQAEILPYLIKKDDLYSLWNKLYLAKIIKENGIEFPVGNTLSEDNIFNMFYFNKIKSLIYIDYSGYNYREVEGSTTRNISKNDYFQNVLSIYNFDYRFYMDLKQTDQEILKLKSEKLINSVVSLIHLYFSTSKQLNFAKRYSYIKAMIQDKNVQVSIKNNWKSLTVDKNKYDLFILQSIKSKSMLNLYLATTYSNFRNKK